MARHKSFASFGRAVKKNAQSIEKEIEDKVARATLSGLNAAIDVTPVDTGRAKGNWHIQNSLDLSKVYEIQSNAQQSALNAYKFRIGSVAYIVNNVEYITTLDDGSSQQAPAGITPSVLSAISAELKA